MNQPTSDKLLDYEIGFVTTKHDRRRPGRVNINSELLPLFRGVMNVEAMFKAAHPERATKNPYIEEVTQERAEEAAGTFAALDDSGNPARGVLISILLVIPIWTAVVGVAYWMLR